MIWNHGGPSATHKTAKSGRFLEQKLYRARYRAFMQSPDLKEKRSGYARLPDPTNWRAKSVQINLWHLENYLMFSFNTTNSYSSTALAAATEKFSIALNKINLLPGHV